VVILLNLSGYVEKMVNFVSFLNIIFC